MAAIPDAQFLEQCYRRAAAAVASGEPVAAEVTAFVESWPLLDYVADALPIDDAELERILRSGGTTHNVPRLRRLPPEHATEEHMCLVMLKALRALYLAPPGLDPARPWAHSRAPHINLRAFAQACTAAASPDPLPIPQDSASVPLTDAQKAALLTAIEQILQSRPQLWPDGSLWLLLLAAVQAVPTVQVSLEIEEQMRLGSLRSLLQQLPDPQRAASYRWQMEALAATAATGAAARAAGERPAEAAPPRPLLTLGQLEYLCHKFSYDIAMRAADTASRGGQHAAALRLWDKAASSVAATQALQPGSYRAEFVAMELLRQRAAAAGGRPRASSSHDGMAEGTRIAALEGLAAAKAGASPAQRRRQLERQQLELDAAMGVAVLDAFARTEQRMEQRATRCNNCGTASLALRTCSRCRATNVECQKEHWRRTHKHECQPAAAQ
eukprot:scaffold16.g61.t1